MDQFQKVIMQGVVLSPSATKLGDTARHTVAVCASHGGVYAAWLALRDEVRAVILNDAGVGLNQAGIAGLDLCQTYEIPAATVSHESCRIGDADHMYEYGTISHMNQGAKALGVTHGLSCQAAVVKLTRSPARAVNVAPLAESRSVLTSDAGRSLVLIDSASLVEPQDDDQIVVCGSHGGLVGGQPRMAIQADVFAAAYNDAGCGFDEAGITRLAALDQRDIAGVTVSHTTAEIGNAQSMLMHGRISYVNRRAQALGVSDNEPLVDVVNRWTLL